MELFEIGKQCSLRECKQLDYLPFQCEKCKLSFCASHRSTADHHCQMQKIDQIKCFQCQTILHIPPQSDINDIVINHLDNKCGKVVKKEVIQKFDCGVVGCNKREIIKFTCRDCVINHCIKHRHPKDHKCSGERLQRNKMGLWQSFSKQGMAALQRAANTVRPYLPGSSNRQHEFGNYSEEDQIQIAIAESLKDVKVKG